ncbi:MAG: cell division ATP-binding protein FtsE [Geminicoccales bacterium]
MLRLQSVAMSYGQGREVLRDVDLTLRAGEFVFLVGPSASGKTSLLRLMGLMRMPSSGRFSLFDRDVTSLGQAEIGALRRRIGMVYQDVRLLDHLSVFDNIALPLRINGGRDEQIGDVVAEMTGWLGLAELIDVVPTRLSMGQRQLVAVARAVITRPGLLLCDEPTGHVDDKLARRVIHLLTQFCKLGSTVVLSTHDHDLVDRYPHPILRMSQGRLSRPAAVPPTMAAD